MLSIESQFMVHNNLHSMGFQECGNLRYEDLDYSIVRMYRTYFLFSGKFKLKRISFLNDQKCHSPAVYVVVGGWGSENAKQFYVKLLAFSNFNISRNKVPSKYCQFPFTQTKGCI
jgi:hypothetical protein